MTGDGRRSAGLLGPASGDAVTSELDPDKLWARIPLVYPGPRDRLVAVLTACRDRAAASSLD